jgi:hypothetical protein
MFSECGYLCLFLGRFPFPPIHPPFGAGRLPDSPSHHSIHHWSHVAFPIPPPIHPTIIRRMSPSRFQMHSLSVRNVFTHTHSHPPVFAQVLPGSPSRVASLLCSAAMVGPLAKLYITDFDRLIAPSAQTLAKSVEWAQVQGRGAKCKGHVV